MNKIRIPATGPEDWKAFLAEPDKHWKSGYSARSLAYCWQEAGGIPKDVISVLSQVPTLNNLKTIFAIQNIKFLFRVALDRLRMMFGYSEKL